MMKFNKGNIFLIFVFVIFILTSCSRCECEETDSIIKIEHYDGKLHIQLDEDSPLEVGKSVCYYIVNDTENIIIFPKIDNPEVVIFDDEKKEWIEVDSNFTFADQTYAVNPQDRYVGVQPHDVLPDCITPLIKNTSNPVRAIIMVKGHVYDGSTTQFEESGVSREVIIVEMEVTLKASQTK